MADEPALTTDVAGLTRTQDGTLLNPTIAPPSPTGSTTTQPPPKIDATLLNKTEPDAPAKTEPTAPDDTKDAKATTAPEKYEDYKLPEGFEIQPEVKAEVDAIFKEFGLTQDQAQKLVDFYASKTVESAQRPYAAYKEMTDGWRKESEDHPDLRGKVGPGQEVNVRIGRALESLGDPKLANDFRSLMDLTGAGNNQAFIRVIDKLAQRAVEGTAVAGRGPSEAGQSAPGARLPSAAQSLYPHLPSINR